MIKHKIWLKWRILFAQVSFEKGVHFPHACEGIYWCTGKLLIINMDGCPKLLNEMLEPDVKTRCNVSGLMLLLTPKWNRVSPSLRVGPELQRTGTHFVPFSLVFKPLLSMNFMIYDVVNSKNQVMILSWFLGLRSFLFCFFFSHYCKHSKFQGRRGKAK